MTTSYVSTPMDRKLLYETLPERLQLFSIQSPSKHAFVFNTMDGDRTSLTCFDLYEQSILFAKGLAKIGIRKGDVIALCLPNCREWLICHFGTLWAGAVTLGIDLNRLDGEDVKHAILKASTCTALVFNGNSDSTSEIIKSFAPEADTEGKIKGSKINGLIHLINSGRKCPEFPFLVNDIISLGQTYDQIVLPRIQPDEVCIIMLTSGTTGFPKLAPWTHFGILSSYCSNGGVMDVKQNDIYFNMMPFSGVAGYVFQFLNVGCTWVTIDSLSTARSIEYLANKIVDIMEEERCNYALIEGPCLYQMMSETTHLKSQFPIDAIFAGGYPMRSSVANIIGRVARRLIYNYGSTEIGFYSAKEITNTNEFTDFNCGIPFPDFEVKVIDDNDAICPRGETGTIYIRSRLTFKGYINDIKSTSLVLRTGGWFDTQDLGYITNGGEIVVLGRKNDMIHVGSANVSPFKMEKLIGSHPDVKTVKIIPVPDEFTFQQLCACIVRKDTSNITLEEIKDFLCRSGNATGNVINTIEIPKYFIFLESLPVSISGKLRKNELMDYCIKYLELC